MRRDKARVEGEHWGDERFEEYLNFKTYDGTDVDFHCLYRAYTRMNAKTFARFVALFKEQGRNVQATDKDGVTLAELIKTHHLGEDYLAVLAE